MTSPIKQKISSVFVHVGDLRGSAEWYSDLLGLPIMEERLNGGPVYWFELEGGTHLILDDNSINKKREDWDSRLAPLYMYPTHNAEEAYRYLIEKNVEIAVEPETPHPGLTFFSIKDPDGNILMIGSSDYDHTEIIHRNRSTPILNRIGAVFAHVKEMKQSINWYHELFNIPYNPDKDWGSIYEIPTEQGAGLLLDNNHVHDNNRALFMFDTEDIEGAYQFIKDRGIEITSEIEKPGPVSFFTFKDLDGNILMVCQNHEQ